MAPKSKLAPLPPEVPVPLNVGERVALADDHKKHGGMYGVIEAIGIDPTDNSLKLDLRLFDPAAGLTENDNTIYRAAMGEIQ